MSQLALWMLVLFPALAGVCLALTGERVSRMAGAIAIGVSIITLALAATVAATRPTVHAPFVPGIDFALGVDTLSAITVVMVNAVALMVLVFASGEVAQARARFFGLMLVFVAAVNATATATTLVALLVPWEVMGAMSFALIGFPWTREHAVASGVTAFLTTRLADLGLYVAAGAAIAGGVSSLSLASLPEASGAWRDVIAAGVLVAALGKAGQLPFSFWLARAMDGPSPVSALLHSAAMVAMGGYLALRAVPLLHDTTWAAPVAAWTGAATALVLGLVAASQRDLKQLLAASTCAQLGFVLLAAGVGSVTAGAMHLLAHAATKALLFLVAGVWLSALGTKQLDELRGAARRMPLVGVCASIGALSLAGVAPLSMWVSKDEVLAAARASSLGLYVVALGAAAASAAYAARILIVVWSVPERDASRAGPRRVGWREGGPLVVLTLGAVGLAALILPPVADPMRRVLDAGSAEHPSMVIMVGSAVLALAVLALVVALGMPKPRWARDWLGLERAAHAVLVGPTLALARSLARFDDAVIAGLVSRSATSTLGVGDLVARFDDAIVDGAVRGATRGAVRSGESAVRVERGIIDAGVEALVDATRSSATRARQLHSGQIRHYYVLAAVSLAVAVTLLLVVR